MRLYEALFILRPDLNKEEVESLLKKVEEFIQKGGGEIKERLEWGVKKLAYPIKKFSEGYYAIYTFQGEKDLAEDFKHAFSREEKILRKLLFRKK